MQIKNGYHQTDAGIIPKDWDSKKLGEIAAIKGGNGFPLVYQGNKAGKHPFFKVSDMNNVGNDVRMSSSNHWIDENTAKKLGATVFPTNSIVFAKVGAAIFLERKRILDLPGCIDNNMSALILNEKQVDCQFIHQSLLLIKFGALVSTTALPSINGSQISEIAIAVPPLAEQKSIAAALSDIDALLSAQEATIAKKRDLKTAAMQQLLSPSHRLPGFSGDWEIKKLEDLGEVLTGLTFSPANVVSDGTLVLRSCNISSSQVVLNDRLFVDVDVSKRVQVETGDILICVRNGSRELIGKCAMISKHMDDTTFGAFMSVFRSPFSNYIFHQFQSNSIKRQINEHLGATINQITNKSLKSFEIDIPPTLAEQNAIASVLSDMDAEIAQLEATHRKTRDLKTGAMQQLLTGAIRLV